MHTLRNLLHDPHLAEVGFYEPNFATPTSIRRSMRQPVIWRGLEREPDRVPPRLGGDGAALLAELGYDRDAASALLEAGAVIAPPPDA